MFLQIWEFGGVGVFFLTEKAPYLWLKVFLHATLSKRAKTSFGQTAQSVNIIRYILLSRSPLKMASLDSPFFSVKCGYCPFMEFVRTAVIRGGRHPQTPASTRAAGGSPPWVKGPFSSRCCSAFECSAVTPNTGATWDLDQNSGTPVAVSRLDWK